MKFRFTLHKDNETLDWITELDLPIPVPNQFYKILDCIAGLVCLLDDCKTKHNLLLWNPLIKEVLILPNPTIENDLVESSCFGFGFDPLNCEYKVVRITYVGVGSWTEVFRVKTQSWVRIDVSCSESLPSIISKQAYVNGHVNWVCSNHMILVFEVRNEVFKEMVLPKALDKVDVHGQTIAVWKGFLSVFAVENFKVCLWVMREYGVEESWTKQCVLEPYTIYRQVQGIRTNGCIIFEDLYSNLTCLDPETQLIEHLALCVQGDNDGQDYAGQQWCVADVQTPDEELQGSMKWACEQQGVDCGAIQENQPCYEPNTVKDHADFAFNAYFQTFKKQGGDCYFNGAAIITELDPSHDNCHFEYLP